MPHSGQRSLLARRSYPQCTHNPRRTRRRRRSAPGTFVRQYTGNSDASATTDQYGTTTASCQVLAKFGEKTTFCAVSVAAGTPPPMIATFPLAVSPPPGCITSASAAAIVIPLTAID